MAFKDLMSGGAYQFNQPFYGNVPVQQLIQMSQQNLAAAPRGYSGEEGEYIVGNSSAPRTGANIGNHYVMQLPGGRYSIFDKSGFKEGDTHANHDIYDATGKYLGSERTNVEMSGHKKFMANATKALTMAMIGGGALGGLGMGPMAQPGGFFNPGMAPAGAGGGIGAAGGAAGFAGDPTAWGYGLAEGAGGGASVAGMGGAGGAFIPAAGAAGGGAALPAVGGSGGLGSYIKQGAAKLFGLGGGGGAGGFDWTDLIEPAISLAGGIYGASQAGKAADSQLQAAREAMALNEPFRQFGLKAGNRMMDELGLSGNTGAEGYGRAAKDFSAADFQADPGYAFRQAEQEKALERAASARGLMGSGKYLKDSMRYSGDLASQEYGKAFDRYQVSRSNRINPLLSIMGGGQTAANTVGEYRTQAGNAEAAGRMGSANAITGAIGQGVSMYGTNRLMNQLLRPYA